LCEGKGKFSVFISIGPTDWRSNGLLQAFGVTILFVAVRKLSVQFAGDNGHIFAAWRQRCCTNKAGTIKPSSVSLHTSSANAVSAAYNFAEHLPERRKMMQAWADYLDGLKGGAEVIPLFRKA